MMRFDATHREAIRQVVARLSFVEKRWEQFEADGFSPDADSADHLLDGMLSLAGRITAAVKTIAADGDQENRADTTADKKKKIWSDDPKVMAPARKMKKELPKGEEKKIIALDFTGGNRARGRTALAAIEAVPSHA